MDPNRLLTAAVQLLVLLLALCWREAVEAGVAYVLGDSTARSVGRTSLDPRRHVDLMGTILVPLMLVAFQAVPFFGWARPIPLRPEKLRSPFHHHLLVRLSGPVANAAFACTALVGLAFAVRLPVEGIREAAQLSLFHQIDAAAGLAGFPLAFTLVQMVVINGFLAVFYLVPVPPLDGGQILLSVMPPDWGRQLERLRPWGFLIAMTLALTQLLTLPLVPLLFLTNLVTQL